MKHFNAVTKYIALALIVCLTFISVTSPVYSLADTKTEYDDNNKELERLRNEQSQLSSELNDLNSELDNAGERLNSINDRIADTQEQIDSLNEDICNMKIERQHQFDTMKLRIQYMYENSDYSFLDVLLSSSSMADLLQRNEYVSRISQYDRKMLEELSSLIAVLNQNQLSLQTNMTELVSLKEQSIAESNNIKRLIASKQSKIDTNSENIAKAEALALEYEERIRQEEIQRQLEEIKKMTVVELSELVKAIEEEFGVSAVAAAAPVAGAAAGEAAAEKTSFNVVLKEAGDQKIKVIKVVRDATGLGLKEAKELVDGAPKTVKENVSKEEAEDLKAKFTEVGAVVDLQ